MSQEDRMIYISDSNNEYNKYIISEDVSEFLEVSRLQIKKGMGENEQADADEIMEKMDSEKQFSLKMFEKLLQGIAEVNLGKHREIVQLRANTSELIVLKLEFGKYFLYIYDTVKSVFKQRLEIKLPACKTYLYSSRRYAANLHRNA